MVAAPGRDRRLTARAPHDPALVAAATIPIVSTFSLSSISEAISGAASSVGASHEATSWILIAYTIAFAVLAPATGKLADLRGTRALLVVGAGLIAAGSLVCLTGASLGALIGGRVLQGGGSGAASTAGFAILATRSKGANRLHRLALLTAGSSIGLGTGPIVGALAGLAGWRAVLALPLGTAAVALLAAAFPGGGRVSPRRFDPLGAVLVGLASVSTLIAAQDLVAGSGALPGFEAVGVTVVVLALLIAHVRTHLDGFVPITILAGTTLRRRFTVAAALSAWSLGTTYLGPQLIHRAEPAWSAVHIGIALTPVAAVAAAVAIASGRWRIDRSPDPILAVVALAGVICGIAQCLFGGTLWLIFVVASGTAGFAVSQVSIMSRLPEDVPAEDVGSAVGLLSLAVILGGALGAALAAGLNGAIGPHDTPVALATLPALAAISATGMPWRRG